MMRYLPHTQEEVREMLGVIGVNKTRDLFQQVPKSCQRKEPLSLPSPMTEWELNTLMENLSDQTWRNGREKVFLGAGSYDHYIPALIGALLSRSEFYTAYTPYQPEVSQGTLQCIFEYQTLVCRLLGMEVANASMYDGATSLAEAILMCLRLKPERKRIALSEGIHPHYRETIRTYLRPLGVEILHLPLSPEGRTDLSSVDAEKDLAGLAIQSPNFLGCVEDLAQASETTHLIGALFVVSFTESLAYGMLPSPGSCGADIACGEGQSLGIPSCFGGPGLGLFACKKEYMRKMPGRLVGTTEDSKGRRGFVLTMATREQHIRREKATSNICSNHSLCATAAAIYLACLGGEGLQSLALQNLDKTEYLKKGLEVGGCVIPFSAPTFNEFVFKPAGDTDRLERRLRAMKIVPGLHLDPFYPGLKGHILTCVTETASKEDLNTLMEEVCGS